MLWLALHLPALSFDAWAATLGAARAALPLALLDGQRVAAVNPVARRLGVEPGSRRATALALVPHLHCGRADPRRDRQALQALAHAALAFTPMVSLDPGAGGPCVLLEVQPSLRCFGGLPRLQQRLLAAVTALQPLELQHRLAAAPTAAAAALFARWRADLALGAHVADRGALHALLAQAPLALLDATGAAAAALQDLGLHTVGQARRLPRNGLARRLGPQLLLALDRAHGDAPDPRPPVRPQPGFSAHCELAERADCSAQLLAAAALLLARLVAWAQAQHARVGGFTLLLQHERRHRAETDAPGCTELGVALAEPSNDPQHLQLLLRERLARLQLPAPTLQLRLRCDRLQHGPAPNGELFPTPASADEGLARLIERLQARLGPQRVCSPVAVADHRPERATAWVPADAPLAARPAAAGVPSEQAAPTRPVWLLEPPQPLPERGGQPWLDGGALQLLAGPERIEAGWWDGAPALRDYFVARAADGALAWIYRLRPGGDAAVAGGWFLHGRFA